MKNCITVCADGVAGRQEIVCEVKTEIKCDHCLTHCQSINYCLSVSSMCFVRSFKYLLHEITSLVSSADVWNVWNFTSRIRTLSYRFLIMHDSLLL